MKIGIDATPLSEQLTGVGNYLFHLLKPLLLQRNCDQFYLYAIRDSSKLQTFKNYPNVVIALKSFLGFSEALWSQTTLSWLAWRDEIDLFWGVTQSVPLLARKKQKQIITIHDFAYLLYPKTTSTVRSLYLRTFGKKLYQKADTRLVISKATGERLNTYFSLQADGVISPPIKKVQEEQASFPFYPLVPKNYYLIVGTLEPRKNIVAALQAYCELVEVNKTMPPLVIVGHLGWKKKEIQKELVRLKKSYPNHIKWMGYLPDTDLFALIKGAKASLMPSLYEGYGMPLAESRTLGTPVICSAIPEMVEAAEGDGYFISLENFKKEFQKALLNPPLSVTQPCHYRSTPQLAEQLSHFFDQHS